MKTRAAALIAGITLAASLSGCTSTSGDAPATDADKALTVRVSNMAYAPASITVAVGETVTWVFDDRGTPHDVVGVGDAKGVLRSPLSTAGTWEFTFTQPGTYDYTCSLHPDMRGAVVVV